MSKSFLVLFFKKELFNFKTPADVSRLASLAAALQALVLLLFIAGTHGWLVPVAPNTTDYAAFYAAGHLADDGMPAAAYEPVHLRAAEAAATQPHVNYEYFLNPPTFLLIMAPFARLPYIASFCLFELLTLGAWLVIGTRVAGGGRAATLGLLAVPSLWWTLGLGQNALLSAALMGAGMLALPTAPIAAGVAFGALCYKPHLGLLIPVALIAGRHWRAVAGAACTVGAAFAATVLLYGASTWRAFFAMLHQNVGAAIDSGKVLLAGRADPTGALQVLGLAPQAARGAWLLALLATVAAIVYLWRRGDREARCAGLAAGVVIAAPFALFYDLVMASLAAAWLVRAGRMRGFLGGEKLLLVALLVANLLAAHPIVAALHVPFGALPGPLLLAFAVRRAYTRDTARDT